MEADSNRRKAQAKGQIKDRRGPLFFYWRSKRSIGPKAKNKNFKKAHNCKNNNSIQTKTTKQNPTKIKNQLNITNNTPK